MSPKSPSSKPTSGRKKSILINTSRVIPRPDRLEGGEETEIAAQISIPHESGWGWVVVISSLCSLFILDGVVYTFGSLLKDITVDLNKNEALVALINSIAVALYFISAPMGSALINRFGFRACTMTGSIICSTSLFITYFATHYGTLCIFYGAIVGFGYSLINLSCGLVVGFYFEKLRAIALSVASIGSSMGVMCFFPLNSYLVQIGGWRLVTLLHSGLFGLIYFFGMAFRPLISLSVITSENDPTRTVTYLPNLSTAVLNSRSKSEGLMSTATERLFGAASNYNFPTAATIIDDTVSNQAGPSKKDKSKITLAVHNPESSIAKRQMKQVQSIVSITGVQKNKKRNIEIKMNSAQSKKKSCCGSIFTWDKHVTESRPLYRDDAFYEGKVENLPEYQKSKLDTVSEGPGLDGLEYRLAVSRAVAAADLHEQRGIFTTAVRRVLATMMDPKLLKRTSFLILCLSGFLTYVGFLVPYVYLKERNIIEGISSDHCNWFVSAIGLSNVFGRISLGLLAYKLEPLYLVSGSCIFAGISTCLSNLSYSIYYQYFYCLIFGFSIASVASLRSMVIVSLYGLEKLTNATGMILFFQGMGSLFSTPVASVLKENFGYDVAFVVAGISITVSGLVVIPVKLIKNKEENSSNKRKRIVKINE